MPCRSNHELETALYALQNVFKSSHELETALYALQNVSVWLSTGLSPRPQTAAKSLTKCNFQIH
jgi:hypothetical protein